MIELNHKRILVTFLMHLGDLVLTTPFIHALRKAAPDACIDMLVDQKLRDVVDHNPCLDNIFTVDKKGTDNSPVALFSIAKKLSQNKYDLLINLHPNERCSFFGAMLRVPKRCGTTHWLFRPYWQHYTPLDRQKHAADMYLDVLTQLGVESLEHNGLELYPGSNHQTEANEKYAAAGRTDSTPLLGFNIGSAVETKRWAPDRFAAVADYWSRRGYRAVFFGSAAERTMVDEAVAHMQSKPIILTGALSLGGLAAALSQCRLVVTNDSGPMHVAIAEKVPVVALYGPSHTDLYGPYTKQAIVVRANPPCPGCETGMKHHCNDLRCMKELTVSQVNEAVHQLLEQQPESIKTNMTELI